MSKYRMSKRSNSTAINEDTHSAKITVVNTFSSNLQIACNNNSSTEVITNIYWKEIRLNSKTRKMNINSFNFLKNINKLHFLIA